MVADGPGEQCVVIDPGVGVTGQLDEIIAEHRLHPVAVLLTHGHLDHTFSVLPVCQARDVPAYIHPDDRFALADPWASLDLPLGSPIFGVAGLTFAEPDDVRPLTDGAADRARRAGACRSGTRPGTPRARWCSTCPPGRPPATSPRVLFAGDVLFAGSIGRTDLPGGSMPADARLAAHRSSCRWTTR